ncbi:hypothetical protein B0J14DRAFT_674595 [Halenospora varia]|nr:hypothetical protein B0J14DRAFT_674595 [Halenospora varia]
MGKVYSVPRLGNRNVRDVEAAPPVENEKPLREKAPVVITSTQCPECQLEAAACANNDAQGHSHMTTTAASSIVSQNSHASHTSSSESQADTVLRAQVSSSLSPLPSALTSIRDHTSSVEEIAPAAYRNPLPKYPAATNNLADPVRYIRPETRPSKLKHLWAVTRLNQWLCFGLFISLTVLIPLAVEAIIWKITGVIPGQVQNSWLTWAYPNPLQSSVVVIEGSSATFTVGVVSKPPKSTLTLVTLLTSTTTELESISTEVSIMETVQSPVPSEPRISQAPTVVEISTTLAITVPPLVLSTTIPAPPPLNPALTVVSTISTRSHGNQERATSVSGNTRFPVFVVDAGTATFTLLIPSVPTSYWTTLKVIPTSYSMTGKLIPTSYWELLNPGEQETIVSLLEEAITATKITPEEESAISVTDQIFTTVEINPRSKGFTTTSGPPTTTSSQSGRFHQRDTSSTARAPVFVVDDGEETVTVSVPFLPTIYWTTLTVSLPIKSLDPDEVEAALSLFESLMSPHQVHPRSQSISIPSSPITTTSSQPGAINEHDTPGSPHTPVFVIEFRTTTYTFSVPLMPRSYWTTLKYPFSGQVSSTPDEEVAMSFVESLASAAKINPCLQDYSTPSGSPSTCTAQADCPRTPEPASTITEAVFRGSTVEVVVKSRIQITTVTRPGPPLLSMDSTTTDASHGAQVKLQTPDPPSSYGLP